MFIFKFIALTPAPPPATPSNANMLPASLGNFTGALKQMLTEVRTENSLKLFVVFKCFLYC